MPGKSRAKDRSPKSVRYDVLQTLDFGTVTFSAASPTTATIQAAFPLASTFKVFAVAVVSSGTVTNVTSIDILYGMGAYSSTTATDDTFDTTGVVNLAAANTSVLGGVQALSTTSGTTQIFRPPVPEAMYGSGNSFTVRASGTTVTGTFNIVLFGKFVDANQLDPQAQTTAGGAPHTFNAGSDPL